MPLSSSHNYFQSLTSPKISADATSQVPKSQPRQLRDLSQETGIYSYNPIVLYSNKDTLFVEELRSTHHKSPIAKEIFSIVRPYKSIYAPIQSQAMLNTDLYLYYSSSDFTSGHSIRLHGMLLTLDYRRGN